MTDKNEQQVIVAAGDVTYTVGKLDVARRQLITAIRMFFNGDDDISVYSLICNAGDIYQSLCLRRGLGSALDTLVGQLPSFTRKTITEEVFAARNFFKHADRDPDAELEFGYNSVRGMLFMVVLDALRLLNDDLDPAIRLYLKWFLTTAPEIAEVFDTRTLVATLALRVLALIVDKQTFGLRYQPKEVQLAYGRLLLQDLEASNALPECSTALPGD